MKSATMICPIFAIVFLFGIISEGDALQCFECNSYSDKRCNNPTNSTASDLVKNCPAEATMCRKIHQIFDMDGGEETRIHRDCATRGNIGECLERTGTNKFKSWYCQCDNEDLCNKATVTTTSTAMTGAIVATVYSIWRVL